MSLNNRQSSSALSTLSKPGEAALRFGELLSQESWAVLGISLNDLQPLVEIYGEAWRDQVLGLVANILISTQTLCGSPGDMLARLTEETFLVITQASSAVLWDKELHKRFRGGILSVFPSVHLCDGMICPSRTRRLPMSSLAIGIVTHQDGPFPTRRDLLKRVTEARNQNERPALLFDLDSLTVTIGRLREEIQVAGHAPMLIPLIECFATVTTGPIHDLRNGLNILYEETRRVFEAFPDMARGESLVAATRYCGFLLETCSEIRFRGVGTPHKVDLSDLLTESETLWISKLDADIAVDSSSGPVEIYADQSQIAQALFNLLSWLVSREGCEEITVACRNNVDRGEIVIAGNFDVAMNEKDLIKQSLAELQSKQQPSLYVFWKLLARYDGNAQFQPGCIILGFPKYQWQDVQSADVLVERIQGLRSQVKDLEAYLDRILPSKDQLAANFSLKDVIGLGGQIIADLADEFGRIHQEAEKQCQSAEESQVALWEPLAAGSHFCQLLAANLLALGGERVTSPHSTSVVGVLESVRRMLRSRIEGIAQFEWNVEADLPPVRATETALAQVLLNLALNSLEELARARPPVSRLGFSARRVQGAVQIDISDTGGGLPTEVVEQLFQGAISTRQHVEGGIGLRVVKSILDELGGEIEFRSAAGRGTTATVRLPIWEGG